MRHTQSSTAVASFSLAVDRDGKDKGTDFINVTAWKNTAEFVCKYFTKGRMAVVDGRLQMDSWTDRDGNKRTSYNVVAHSVYFGDSRREESDSREPDYAPPPRDFTELTDDDVELPFKAVSPFAKQIIKESIRTSKASTHSGLSISALDLSDHICG
ncbi:MAG: single-stranded DNA-binding protein [Faecalispora jeddahensis]